MKHDLIKFIREAIDISESIYIKYRLLKSLDASKFNDFFLFNQTKLTLLNICKKEKELYKKANISADEAALVIRVLVDELNNVEFNKTLDEYMINGIDNTHAILRVYKKIQNILNRDVNFIYREMKNSNCLIPLNEEEIKQQIKKNFIMDDAISYNYYLIFLSFLDSVIKNNDNEIDLTSVKYDVPFLKSDIEEFFLKNNCYISDSLYLNHLLIGDECCIPKSIQGLCINKLLIDVNKHRKSLLKIKDNDFNNKSKEILVRSYFIRSANILLPNNDLGDVAISNNVLAANELKKIYEFKEKDKELHKTLSLTP